MLDSSALQRSCKTKNRGNIGPGTSVCLCVGLEKKSFGGGGGLTTKSLRKGDGVGRFMWMSVFVQVHERGQPRKCLEAAIFSLV